MGRLTLNKGTLQGLFARLRVFERALPSLDMKRKQLSAELHKAQRELIEQERRCSELLARAANDLPMLGRAHVDFSQFVRVRQVRLATQNVLGAQLPRLQEVEFALTPYAYLNQPPWLDTLVLHARGILALRVEVQVQQERVRCLERALRRTLQRVNLLEKVLIPQTRLDIGRVKIFLADADRTAVVRAKMSKRKRAVRGSASL